MGGQYSKTQITQGVAAQTSDLVLKWQKQVTCEFKANLNYVSKLCLKKVN